MTKDYSQWGEQEHILRFFADSAPGKFLDLGSFDGVTGSNTRALSDRYWRGVCVEASADAFMRLVHNHTQNKKIQCLLAAIVPDERSRIPVFYDAGDQVSTVYRQHHLETLVRQAWYVAGVTPAEVAVRFGGNYDFVSVDVEGLELELVPALGPLLTTTKLVCFEDYIPNTEFDEEYYSKLREAWNAHGFTKEIARTKDCNGKPANTLLARA